MNNIVERLKEQSTIFNSPWVMKLFAEAAVYIEMMEQENVRLKMALNANYGELSNPMSTGDDISSQYDNAMKIVHQNKIGI